MLFSFLHGMPNVKLCLCGFLICFSFCLRNGWGINVWAIEIAVMNRSVLYAPYRVWFISNKFWIGRGEEAGSGRGRSDGAELEGENKRGGEV